jgi:hypothetical protein
MLIPGTLSSATTLAGNSLPPFPLARIFGRLTAMEAQALEDQTRYPASFRGYQVGRRAHFTVGTLTKRRSPLSRQLFCRRRRSTVVARSRSRMAVEVWIIAKIIFQNRPYRTRAGCLRVVLLLTRPTSTSIVSVGHPLPFRPIGMLAPRRVTSKPTRECSLTWVSRQGVIFEYKANALTAGITLTTVWSRRDGVEEERVWP